MILGILWLVCYNLEIDWRIVKVQITRCLNECGKKQRVTKQMKLGWQKQKEKK